MSKLLIRNGRVIDPACGRDQIADVLIEGSLIVAVGPGLDGDGAEVLDATGLVVAPGFIDMHAMRGNAGGTERAEALQAVDDPESVVGQCALLIRLRLRDMDVHARSGLPGATGGFFQGRIREGERSMEAE